MPRKRDDDAPFDLNEGAENPDETNYAQVRKLTPAERPVFGTITADEIIQLVKGGLPVPEIQALALGGMNVDQLAELAQMRREAVAAAAPPTPRSEAGEIASAIRDIKTSRSRRPESYNGDFPYPAVNHFNPAGGDMPALKCPMFLGMYERQTNGSVQVTPCYPLIADETGGMTMEERTLLNALEPGIFTVTRRDDISAPVRVVVDTDPTGKPERLVIAVPKLWLDRLEHRSLPSVRVLAKQLDPQTGTRSTAA